MDNDIKEYLMEKFGRIHPAFEVMDRYNPELLKGFVTMRRATLKPKDAPEGALPEKIKELIIVAVEVALGRGEGGKSHARRAVRLGATAKEVEEAVELCTWLAGWSTWVDCGMDAVLAAEDEERKMKEGKPFYWTSEVTTSEEKQHSRNIS
jgi:alkylhydroperoxidase/carboxymuconolactone decarboxylase family protein YurZ